MAKKVSLLDVAEAAGVSLATVDRVINGRGGVRADREERVLRAAHGLGLNRRNLQPPTQIRRVAVMLHAPSNPFHAALADGTRLMRPACQLLSIQLQIHHIAPNAPLEIAGQIAALSKSCDGFIISGPDTPEVAAALRQAAETMPVVTLATDIEDSGRAAYIGPDDARAGRAAGDLIGRFLGPAGGEVLMVAAPLDIAGQRARAQGITEMLAKHHPSAKIAEIVETGDTSDATAVLVRAALRKHRNLRAIYHTTTGAVRILDALEEMGRAGEVVIVTHELTPNRRALLRARKLDAVIDQNPTLEARLAVETVARLLGRLEGEPGSIATETQIYMPENA